MTPAELITREAAYPTTSCILGITHRPELRSQGRSIPTGFYLLFLGSGARMAMWLPRGSAWLLSVKSKAKVPRGMCGSRFQVRACFHLIQPQKLPSGSLCALLAPAGPYSEDRLPFSCTAGRSTLVPSQPGCPPYPSGAILTSRWQDTCGSSHSKKTEH